MKTVVITGATSGIGNLLVREFVRRDRIAYPWGKDFQTHDKEHRRRVSVEPGFPDHAIVKGYLSTEKDQKK